MVCYFQRRCTGSAMLVYAGVLARGFPVGWPPWRARGRRSNCERKCRGEEGNQWIEGPFVSPGTGFQTGIHRRRANYLTIVLLIGLVGGVAVGSISAARRTQSSFNTFLTSTNPSDLSVLLGGPNLTSNLARLPLRTARGGSSSSTLLDTRPGLTEPR